MSREVFVADNTYNDVQIIAERLGLTPDEFINDAAEQMVLKNLTSEEVIARINKVCETEDTSLDPVIAEMQAQVLERNEW